MMRRLREIPCRMLARTAVQRCVLVALIHCATMATEVVEVATEGEEDVRFPYSGKIRKKKNPFFWRSSMWFCGFQTPLSLRPPLQHSQFLIVKK